jgi:hypothetical protein
MYLYLTVIFDQQQAQIKVQAPVSQAIELMAKYTSGRMAKSK